jgi:hypothetical protein
MISDAGNPAGMQWYADKIVCATTDNAVANRDDD